MIKSISPFETVEKSSLFSLYLMFNDHACSLFKFELNHFVTTSKFILFVIDYFILCLDIPNFYSIVFIIY